MQLDWESLVKRYVYNDAKTPYFTAVPSPVPVLPWQTAQLLT